MEVWELLLEIRGRRVKYLHKRTTCGRDETVKHVLRLQTSDTVLVGELGDCFLWRQSFVILIKKITDFDFR